MPFTLATDTDLPAVVALVNSSYRGETSRQGWTTEADFLDGERTNEAQLREELAAKPGSRLLIRREKSTGEMLACVLLAPGDDGLWHLGMLTVRPDEQDRLLGRQLLAEAETVARADGARRIRMTVVSVRDTLIAWYRRRGYVLTGETLPFPYGDPPPDLEFVVLEKPL